MALWLAVNIHDQGFFADHDCSDSDDTDSPLVPDEAAVAGGGDGAEMRKWSIVTSRRGQKDGGHWRRLLCLCLELEI